MNEEKVTEILDEMLPAHGAVYIELRDGTQFNVAGTRHEIYHEIYGSKLKIYRDNDLMASVHLVDIAFIGLVV